ncbi:hypothetical protein EVAR_54377_1 [Eumeta japonica]|uniref:Uncharacterized protein n=1 Tax=Eumeta variegata TaxID=151549 RepID=A0A4C1Y3U5_EUMVA|nr:hypothetical protein EVAR_54377_1 [Eumeta japonica]
MSLITFFRRETGLKYARRKSLIGVFDDIWESAGRVTSGVRRSPEVTRPAPTRAYRRHARRKEEETFVEPPATSLCAGPSPAAGPIERRRLPHSSRGRDQRT